MKPRGSNKKNIGSGRKPINRPSAGVEQEGFRVARSGAYLEAAGNRGDDADLVTVVGGGAKSLHETNVFAVQVYVDEVAQFAFFVNQTIFETREFRVQVIYQFTENGGRYFYFIFAVCHTP
jgi:hypothetical protein